MAQIEDWPPSLGPWRTEMDRETGIPHLIPAFGPQHAFYPECWCHPQTSKDRALILHNVAQ